MELHSNSFQSAQPIPAACAYCTAGSGGEHSAPGGNRNPHLAWRDVPEGTRSFVLMCVDSDVPAAKNDVNKEGRTIATDAPRTDFLHWLMIDIPRECAELGEGSCSEGTGQGGKSDPPGPPGSRQAINDFTGPSAADAKVVNIHRGYDGPCPPWNDERLHHYRFSVHALDVARLDVGDDFTLADVRTAMRGHELAEADLVGTYSTNPALLA